MKHTMLHSQCIVKEVDGKKTFDFLPSEKTKYGTFLSSLSENQTIDLFIEASSTSGTLPQLAKIHASIRQLALDTGETFESMKFEIKKRSGLCVIKEFRGEKVLYCKSFAKCSVEELNLVIQTVIELGDFTGGNYR